MFRFQCKIEANVDLDFSSTVYMARMAAAGFTSILLFADLEDKSRKFRSFISKAMGSA